MNGSNRPIDPSVDQRPRVTLHYSTAGWRCFVSDSTPRGGAVNIVAAIAVSGPLTVRDVPATRVRETKQEAVYLLSRAGRFHVELSRPNRPASLWRDITVRPRESLVLEVLQEEGAFRGASEQL